MEGSLVSVGWVVGMVGVPSCDPSNPLPYGDVYRQVNPRPLGLSDFPFPLMVHQMTKYVREFLSAVNHSASLDNRFGHKMLAVCYGFILGPLFISLYLDLSRF